jgi:hypothetical protein
MQIGAKMVHRPTMGNLTHKHTIVQICNTLIILLPIIYFVIDDEGYIKMAKSLKTPTREYQNFLILSSYESYDIVGS